MRLITRQSLANEVANRWDRQYPPKTRSGRDSLVSERLHALGPTPDPDDVDRVINEMFPHVRCSLTTPPACDDCGGSEFPAVVECGEEEGYGSITVNLCGICIAKALGLIHAASVGATDAA